MEKRFKGLRLGAVGGEDDDDDDDEDEKPVMVSEEEIQAAMARATEPLEGFTEQGMPVVEGQEEER
jgi:hypothetical protein